jgi:hypothetical protein
MDAPPSVRGYAENEEILTCKSREKLVRTLLWILSTHSGADDRSKLPDQAEAREVAGVAKVVKGMEACADIVVGDAIAIACCS